MKKCILLVSFIFSHIVFAKGLMPSNKFEMKCKSNEGTYINFFLGSAVNPKPNLVLDIEIINSLNNRNVLDFSYFFSKSADFIRTNDRFYLYDNYPFPSKIVVEFNRIAGNSFDGFLNLINSNMNVSFSFFEIHMVCTSSDFL